MFIISILLAITLCGQDDDSIAVALGPVTAIKPVVEKATADGKGVTLETLVRGVETALTAELSNNNSPFALIGGNMGANLYKQIVVDQKSPTESDGEDEVQYGLSVEITAFSDAQIGPTQSGGLTVVQREITVMASAVMHDVGRMRAAIAIPPVTAIGKQVTRVRTKEELVGVLEQSDILIGSAQQDLAKKLATGLLAAYYKFPAYVIAVDNNEITIDQGKAWCKVGDVLTLYGPPTEVEKPGRGRIKKSKIITLPGKRAGTITITECFGDTSRGKFTGENAEVDGVAYRMEDQQ